MTKKKRIIIISSVAGGLAAVIVALTVLLALAGVIGIAVYANDYYRADEVGREALAEAKKDGNNYIFESTGDIGLVFYPGGKVDVAAYAPLMHKLATDYGITCVLVEMPMNLAVLNAGAWKNAVKTAPDVKTWYIGGHSLGGAMAAGQATEENGFAGLVLLAAYPTDTVSVPVLSIYGDNDGVMDREKYEAGLAMMPDATEFVITGGNHAGFGYYGEQGGDGEAALSREIQQDLTCIEISKFVS